ncbi:hypothetical protein ACAG26_26335 [Mycobacterium sp. pUA109]|uniref:hypothetical protein n=1 Tax=Mycobacterium sp. pUA109 TaxID=3238982 RepID=UPI00351BD594
MVLRLLAPILAFGALTAGAAAADPESCQWDPKNSERLDPASPEVTAILKPAVADLTQQLGKPAKLGEQSISRSGQWMFVEATILGADGRPIDYTGTPFAEAAAHGGKSKKYLALLRHDDHGWNLVTRAIGPTDAQDRGWPEKYGSPPVYFICN